MNQSIIQVIKSRQSIRTYSGEPIEADVLESIQNYIDELTNPFNRKVVIKIIKPNNYKKEKFGTYGVIKNPSYFFVAYCEDKPFALEALGYMLEKVVLYCTSLNLGTVWLGGTFNRSKFARTINLPDGYIMPAVVPFGHPGDRRTPIGFIIGSNHNKRETFAKLFTKNNFFSPMSKKQAGIYADALEALRLAPSSRNCQPWRAVLTDDGIHFYSTENKDINKVDMGIAFSHLAAVLEEQKVKGKFKIVNPNLKSDYEYVISWIPEKYF